MVPTLRPYQAAAIEALRSHVRAGRSRVLLVAATGSGKTVIASSLIHSARANHGARILFLAHRSEIIDQTVRHLAHFGVTDVGVIRADDDRTNPACTIQVASIQTLIRRAKPEADIVICDEAHRSAGESFRRVLSEYPDATIIGLTATPVRLDGRPLGDVFQALEQVATYSELIAGGFVMEPVVYSTAAGVDLSSVRTSRGDYREDDLEAAMSVPHVMGDIVANWKRHAGNKRTVVYACTVAHSMAIVKRFHDAGIVAEHLDGATPEDERAAILARLESGETRVVSNCQILTEGWDMPACKCVVMARPTQSLSLYMQCVGRALRPWGEDAPVVLDHSGNMDRHGHPTIDREWSLLDKPKTAVKSEFHVCKGCYAYVKKNPCELCGFAHVPTEREIREQAAELVVREPVDERRATFMQSVYLARSRGFKPGFAGAKFKEKFGAWPPWSWSNEAKAMFANDKDWQERLDYREREKAHWAEVEAKEKAKMEAENDALPDDALPDDGIPF